MKHLAILCWGRGLKFILKNKSQTTLLPTLDTWCSTVVRLTGIFWKYLDPLEAGLTGKTSKTFSVRTNSDFPSCAHASTYVLSALFIHDVKVI